MIRQFDVYANPGSSSRDDAPYICVLQSHYLDAIDTVVVAPLLNAKGEITPTQVAVPVQFDGADYLLDPSLVANIERSMLGRRLGDLASLEFEIRRGLDRLFTGF